MNPPLVVSMGDPAGIGLEIAAKAWQALRVQGPVFFVIGDPEALAAAAPGVALHTIASPEEAPPAFFSALPVLPLHLASPPTPGQPDPANGPAIIEAIRRGVGFAQSGAAGGLVTLPIAKSVLYKSGFGFPGHTEYIAHLTGAAAPVMMLAGESLRVALATIHLPLRDVPQALRPERLEQVARTTLAALHRDFGLSQPRLAVAGLNPHAGENGALGLEEQEIINPVMARLRAQGHQVSDAQPADSLFHSEARANYDAVLAMTHDQGLIPLKTLHFWDAVNVTLGLPIVRTSPDHGTGFAIAGRGIARADSLIAALRLAGAIAARRAAA